MLLESAQQTYGLSLEEFQKGYKKLVGRYIVELDGAKMVSLSADLASGKWDTGGGAHVESAGEAIKDAEAAKDQAVIAAKEKSDKETAAAKAAQAAKEKADNEAAAAKGAQAAQEKAEK